MSAFASPDKVSGAAVRPDSQVMPTVPDVEAEAQIDQPLFPKSGFSELQLAFIFPNAPKSLSEALPFDGKCGLGRALGACPRSTWMLKISSFC